MAFTVLIFWLGVLSKTEISAQYRFDSWTTDNGLPQVSVNSILQTRDGFLWLTTFGGLARYDGLRFQVYNSGNTKGLRTSRFLNLFEDIEGNLWITTEGQGITRYRDGSFTTYTTENGLPGNLIRRMDKDANGDFLLEVGEQILRWKDEAFVSYTPADGEPTKNILQRTRSGAVWYLENSRLRKFENGRITTDYAPNFSVLRVFEDSQGRLWITRNGRNLLSMLKDGKLTNYLEKDGYPEFRFGTVFEDWQGGIWFATRSGLIRYQDEKFTRYQTADGLISDDLTHVYQDREGTIWVGTSGGLSRLTERTVTAYSTQNGLAADNVYPIYQDRSGKIWIGSWAGLTVYENGVFQNVGERYSVADQNITALFEDREGTFWIGNWAGEIKQVKGDSVTTISPGNKTTVRVIYQDRAGTMWFGTSDGLLKGTKDEGKGMNDTENFSFIRHPSSVIPDLAGKEIFAIREDRRGQLWIGTSAGLIIYRDNVFTPLTEADGIAGGIVRSIYEDADGALWIGMYDSGLYRFKDGRFTHFTTNEGLFDNGAFQIIEDGGEQFWISCNLGIYRVRKSELNDFADGQIEKVISIPYNKRDGMLNSECNGGASPAGIKALDGRIWFPTQKGIAVINPETVPFNSHPPPVVIESLVVDTKPFALLSPVKIEPGQTNLEIHYAGLSFINPELVKFKYKLEGLDEDWIDATTRRTAFYSHLPPGKYLFTVIAANRDGVWNEQGAKLEITVVAPFWRTDWFIALAALAVIATVFSVFRLRENELKRRQLVQQEFSRRLLESQEAERKRIASEMHDSLGQYLLAIKNWALFGLNSLPKEDAAREYLDEVSETSSLALNEVREIAHNLRPYQLERLGLTNTLEYMLKNLKTPTRFTSEIENIDGALSKDSEIVFYRIVQESVNNVIKHSQANNARISVKRNGENLEFVCRDDGRGFDFETAKNSPESGLGLNGMIERVKILKGIYEINSEAGVGTTVSIKAPLN